MYPNDSLYEQSSELKKAFRRGFARIPSDIDQFQGTFHQALGDDAAAQANFEQARQAEEELAARQGLSPRISSIRQVRSPGDLGDYLSSTVGETLPLVGSMALGGGLAGGFARALGAGARGTALAAGVGTAAPYEATSVAEASRDIMRDPAATGTPQEQAIGALATGTAKTALGMAPLSFVANRALRPGGTMLGRAGQGALVGGLTEGGTEVGEELIGKYGHQYFNPDVTLGDEEDLWDYADAFVGGAAVGSPLGGAAGLAGAARNKVLGRIEDGEAIDVALQRLLDEDGDVLDAPTLNTLQTDLESGAYNTLTPRSRIQRRIDDMEADEVLDQAYMSAYGTPRTAYQEARAAERDKWRAQLEDAAAELLWGDPERPEVQQLVADAPEDLRNVVQELLEQSNPSHGVTADRFADSLNEVPDRPNDYVLNQKGEAWKTDTTPPGELSSSAFGKAYYDQLAEQLSPGMQQRVYKMLDENAEVVYPDRFPDKRAEVASTRAWLRGETNQVQTEDAATSRNPLDMAPPGVRVRRAPAEQAYEALGIEGDTQGREAISVDKPPSSVAGSMPSLSKEQLFGMPKGRHYIARKRLEEEINTLNEINRRGLLDGLDEQLIQEYESARSSRNPSRELIAELEGYSGVQEYLRRKSSPDYQDTVIQLKRAEDNLRQLERSDEGILTLQASKHDNFSHPKRIKVEQFNAKDGRWRKMLLDPMKAAQLTQSEERYSPKDPVGTAKRQVLNGLVAVLTHPEYAVRLNGPIDPDTVVYTRNLDGGEKEQVTWGDIVPERQGNWQLFTEGLARRAERLGLPNYDPKHWTGEDEARFKMWAQEIGWDLPIIQENNAFDPKEEYPEYRGKEGKVDPYSLPVDEGQTTTGGVQKDPGEYSFDLDKRETEQDAVRTDSPTNSAPKSGGERSFEQDQAYTEANPPERPAVTPEGVERKPEKPFTPKEKTYQGKRKRGDFPNSPDVWYSAVPGGSEAYAEKVRKAFDTEKAKKNRASMQRLIEHFSKALGMRLTARMAPPEEAEKHFVRFNPEVDMLNGFAEPVDGVWEVWINPLLPHKAQLETFAHEFGHLVIVDLFKNASPKTKTRIKEAHRTWAEKAGMSDDMLQLFEARSGQAMIDVYTEFLGRGRKLSDVHENTRRYLLSFDEWFADQVSMWMTTEAKPLTAIEHFFKHVADVITDLFNLFRANKVPTASKEVKDYLNSLYKPERAPFIAETKGVSDEQVELRAAFADVLPGWTDPQSHDLITRAMFGNNILHGDEKNALRRMVQGSYVRNQLIDLYGQDQGAMAILDNNDSNRAAGLAYLAWRAGKLKVSKRGDSLFAKIAAWFRELFGVITNEDNALALFKELSPSTLREGRDTLVRDRVNDTMIQQTRKFLEDMSAPVLRYASQVVLSAEGRIRQTNNAELIDMWRNFYTPPDTPGGRESYFAARQRQRAFFTEKLHDIYDGEDAQLGTNVRKILQGARQEKDSSEKEVAVARQTRALLKSVFLYAKERGVRMGNLGEDYFPRVWDAEKLQRDGDKFRAMLEEKYADKLVEYGAELNPEKPLSAEAAARVIAGNLVRAQGEEVSATEMLINEAIGDPLGWPSNAHMKERSLRWLKDKDIAPFMSENLGEIVSTYINQMVKRAEYSKRFGIGVRGAKTVDQYIKQARQSGASDADIDTARNTVMAAMGTLGADINPTVHKVQGALMVVQNWLVLGLATASSLVDPMGIAVRGDLDTAWVATKAGLKEAAALFKEEGTDINALAKTLGINELASTLDALGYEYGGYYVTGESRKWNDRLFAWNGLQLWTQLTRTMALAGAKRFIEKHGDFAFNEHSARYMGELGVRKGDIKLDDEGNLVLLSNAEREELRKSRDQLWDDPNLAKHLETEGGATPSTDLVNQRFNDVDWGSAPIGILRSMLQTKVDKLKSYYRILERSEREGFFGMDAMDAEDALADQGHLRHIIENIEDEREVLIQELKRRNDSKDARAFWLMAEQTARNAEFTEATYTAYTSGRQRAEFESEYRNALDEIADLPQAKYDAQKSEIEKWRKKYEKQLSKDEAYWNAEGARVVKELKRKAEALKADSEAFDKAHSVQRKGDDSIDAEQEIARDERVRAALNRWVDEAILRPDAAQRPVWASDPHWMLVFHLKAFMYSFHERILRRVGHEMMNGRYTPAMMMMGYLPVMYVAEGLRNTIQGDDMDDVLPEDAGFLDTTHYLAQKAGLYGPAQMVFDVSQGWRYGDTPLSTLGGPTVDHALDVAEAITTESTSDDVNAAIRSAPLHTVWKDWVK